MDCPRCKTTLTEKTIQDHNLSVDVDQCATCNGIWFDEGELSQIEQVSEPTIWEVRKIPKEQDQLIGLYCPKCSDAPLMKKAEHSRDNKVILDYCEHCRGIWLDGGELEAIQKENWLLTIGHLFDKLMR